MSVLAQRRPKQRVHQRILLETSLEATGADMPPRQRPNILVTGTPGTGKSTTAGLVAAETNLKLLNVGDLVREHDLHDGYDEEYQAYYINDDKVNDFLEDVMADGGVLLDHHSSDFFPERFFDLVVVLQADNTVLYDRLTSRGYTERKVQENVECEIMHVPVEEARRSYRPEVVQCLQSNDTGEMEENVERIVEWCRRFCAANGGVL